MQGPYLKTSEVGQRYGGVSAWETEDEIKQVVESLRQIFGTYYEKSN